MSEHDVLIVCLIVIVVCNTISLLAQIKAWRGRR